MINITLESMADLDMSRCVTDLYDVHKVANLEKKVPRSWITEEGDYVTAEMKNYIEPLIQAELTPIMITGQPRHIIIDDL